MLTLKTADDISLAKIKTISEGFRERVSDWYHDCLGKNLLVYIYCGYRSSREQDELYKIGRETPGSKVTNARGGQSFHNYGRAIDWVPLKPYQKSFEMFEAAWESKYQYEQGQLIAARYDMRCLSWEAPHLEDGNFKDWHELSKSQKPASSQEYNSAPGIVSDQSLKLPRSVPLKKSSRPATGWRSR